ncbi:MAG: hypothetical protein DRJ66_02170 [Thermoprotei archaeon]|nr:MAG: hypothetical protein DRJ66_02170 [Thermoprotei archaeon]RLF19848.1 MAG: hypothetical protein DRZ82_04425 [Thermoprotei archaeon]
MAWFVIALAIHFNPWFILTKHALSDLGTSRALMPQIYNYGLMITAMFVILFSGYLAIKATNKVETFAAAYLSIAGMFLALIGIFPGGTKPHTFVSTWFFIQAQLSVLMKAIGVIRKSRKYAILLFALFLLAILGGLLEWPSVAIEEIYEIILLDVYVIMEAIIYS